ncbi:hypothetical protein [Escherichia phage IMM-001]|nr:hypothetical protein [Escherichia phage IMM-001]
MTYKTSYKQGPILDLEPLRLLIMETMQGRSS